mmetsp:Transcript_56582/g.120158  ORF Transcript_56582/g.120158 Transcript_56582/m.120158 type:complete len:267 (+) Transcript_56582:103-903(+)
MLAITVVSSLRHNSKGFFPVYIIAHVMSCLLVRPTNAFAILSHHLQSTNLLSQRHQNVILERIYPTARRNHKNKNHWLNLTSSYSLDLSIPTAEDMEDIGGLLSVDSTNGDVILLDGDLGAGKTCFSRGFIRARTGLGNERVTSPTYLLSNTYSVNGGNTKIYHMDLYRLSGTGDDLAPLDLENVFSNGISLIEWPSRLKELPSARLDISLSIDSTIQNDDCGTDSKRRFMKLMPYGDRWVERLAFLESEGYFEDLILDSSIIDQS